MSEFAIQVENREGGVVIRLAGELTVADTAALHEHLAALQGPGGANCVVLDISGLRFICSAALGQLIEFRKHLLGRGAVLRLAGASSEVTEVFRKTRLYELFPMYGDAEAALHGG